MSLLPMDSTKMYFYTVIHKEAGIPDKGRDTCFFNWLGKSGLTASFQYQTQLLVFVISFFLPFAIEMAEKNKKIGFKNTNKGNFQRNSLFRIGAHSKASGLFELLFDGYDARKYEELTDAERLKLIGHNNHEKSKHF